MQKFPHLVEMHRKFAGDGLVALSVSKDPPDKEYFDKVQKFLTRQQATFTNFILDEPMTVWENRLHVDAFPCYMVFDRQGKWTQFKDDGKGKGPDYAGMDKLIARLLQKK
jgi:hypothetical protein